MSPLSTARIRSRRAIIGGCVGTAATDGQSDADVPEWYGGLVVVPAIWVARRTHNLYVDLEACATG